MKRTRRGLWRRALPVGLLVAFAVAVVVCQLFVGPRFALLSPLRSGTVEIHVIDVGQADCTLIRTESGCILIDAGVEASGDSVVRYLRRAGVESLAYAVFTHPESDHIGGAAQVLQSFDVATVIVPYIPEEELPGTAVYDAFCRALSEKESTVTVEAITGTEYHFGEMSFLILAPNSVAYENMNDYSVALRFDFEDTSFLFTGDAEAASESEMLALYPRETLDCDFFHAGHHGANTSNGREFLEAVSPEIVAVSCGENFFGHPSGETVVTCRRLGATVYRTDELGTLVFISDGKQIEKR